MERFGLFGIILCWDIYILDRGWGVWFWCICKCLWKVEWDKFIFFYWYFVWRVWFVDRDDVGYCDCYGVFVLYYWSWWIVFY